MNSRVVCRDFDNGAVPRERWAAAFLPSRAAHMDGPCVIEGIPGTRCRSEPQEWATDSHHKWDISHKNKQTSD